MQSIQTTTAATTAAAAGTTAARNSATASTTVGVPSSAYVGYQIIRRNGAVVSFEPNKIAVALM